jgi:hypothetical protein
MLGEHSLHIVSGTQGSLKKWRGSIQPIPACDNRMIGMPTLHPSDVMREQTSYPVVLADLTKSLVVPKEHYILFPTLEEVREFKATEFAFDIETPYEGHTWQKEKVNIIALSAKSTSAIVVPFHGAYAEEIKRIFRNAKHVIGHNAVMFDLEVLKQFDVQISPDCQISDTMLMHHLRFPHFSKDENGDKDSSGGHGLEFVASCFISKPAWKHDKDCLELYAARDVDATMQIYEELKVLCEQAGQVFIHDYEQIPLAKICYLMQKTGIKRDPSRLKQMRERLLKEISEEETKLPPELRGYDEIKHRNEPAPEGYVSPKTGKPVKKMKVPYAKRIQPWKSDKVKKEYLYNKLKIEPQYNVKTKRLSCDKDALDRIERRLLSRKYKVVIEGGDKTAETAVTVALLKSLNQKATLVSNFCKESEEGVSERIHPNFNPHGTSAHRLSSANPSFQNQPEDARYMYVAGE